MGWLSALMERRTLRAWAIIAVVGAVAAVLLIGMQSAFASHPVVSLPGSNFEIENSTPNTLPGANLKVDDPAPSQDWASVNEDRKADKPTGQNDDSFVQGTKEDSPVPTIEAGSIPNNKSDLLNFGVYLEQTGTQSFLHLFWHRVQEPTGTTNMDFEFNKRQCTPNPSPQPPTPPTDPDCSSNGITPLRSAGDVLIQYDLAQGGTNPQLFLSRWVTTGNKSQCEAANSVPCWSDKINLTAAGDATGSINNVAIPSAESDGLAPSGQQVSPRTFGEASVDFDALGTGSDPCATFGSAYLKSRASDSFTAAMKDFIAPLNKNIGNCGRILIDKVTDPANDPKSFDFTLTGGPSNLNQSFSLTHAATPHDSGGILPGSGYSAAETVPARWDLTSATCSDGSPVDNINVSTGETVTCTFTNTKRGNIIIDKVTDPSGDPQEFDFTLTGGPDNVNRSFSLTDAATPRNSGPIKPGSYSAAETVPAGWDLDEDNTSCDDDSPVNNISLSAGETVTCTFTNVQQRGEIVIDKVTDPSGDPQKFNFTLTGGPSNLNQSFQLDDDDTPHDSGAVKPGNNYVADETVPADWELDEANTSCDDANSTVDNIDVSPGETVTCTFTNLKQTTSISTEQSFTPQDTATITGTGSGAFNGQVDFELYKGEDCTGDPVYFERNVALPPSGSVSTTNGDPAGANHDDPYTIEEDTAGEYHWKVSYHDDPNHPDATSCVEESTVTIDNDNTP